MSDIQTSHSGCGRKPACIQGCQVKRHIVLKKKLYPCILDSNQNSFLLLPCSQNLLWCQKIWYFLKIWAATDMHRVKQLWSLNLSMFSRCRPASCLNQDHVTRLSWLFDRYVFVSWNYEDVTCEISREVADSLTAGILIVIHLIMSHSSLNNNRKMPYPVWNCMPYESPQPS